MCYGKASFRPGHKFTMGFITKDSENISRGPDNCPVYHLKVKIKKTGGVKKLANLNEGDNTESKTKSKEAAKRGEKVHPSHPRTSLHFYS